MATGLNGNTAKAAAYVLIATMALTIFILTMFRNDVSACRTETATASALAQDNRKDIAVTQEGIATMKEDLQEIKGDVRAIRRSLGIERGER